MSDPMKLDALGVVLVMLRKVKDPAERIRAIRAVRAEVARYDARFDRLTRGAIEELRRHSPPATWAEIGALLGVTPQRAHQLARTEDPETTPAESSTP